MLIDKLDARLLDLVQRNNRLSAEELGERIGLSASGVHRRLRRLRANEAIEADVSIVLPQAVGRHVTVLLLLTFKRDRSDILDCFKRSVCAMDEVMSGFFVTGETDCVLLVTARDTRDFERFSERLTSEHPEIGSVRSIMVMDRIKSGFTLPIGAMAGW